MLYDYVVTIPAGTSERSPKVETLKLTRGVILHLDVEFPAGCRGYVSAVIRRGSHQLYPTNPSGDLHAEDFTVQTFDLYPLFEEPYSVKVYGWSPDADYDHDITVRISLVRVEDLVKLLPILQGLERLLEYIGMPPAEEIPPVVPPPPPPESECTLGDKKCEGSDLYECQEVEGVGKWVLIEENSPECTYVPPEPKCTLGDKKCEGYDLYECREVEGTNQWVLIEEKSEACGYTPDKPPVPSEGEILEITWVKDGIEHPLTDPIPRFSNFYQRFKIKNTGDHTADYRVAHYVTGYGEGFKYTRKVTLAPTQIAYIDHPYYASAMPGEYTKIWYLFSYDEVVHQVEAKHYTEEVEE